MSISVNYSIFCYHGFKHSISGQRVELATFKVTTIENFLKSIEFSAVFFKINAGAIRLKK